MTRQLRSDLVVADGALDLIGRTPLVELRLVDGAEASRERGAVFAKVEFWQPGGSIKDRAALGMIREAERQGLLVPGATIIEPTAGNTGVGLAIIGCLRGYRLICVMPEKFLGEKSRLMEALGAEVVTVPTEAGMPAAIAKAKEIQARTPHSYVPQQFANPANPAIHYETTGAEIWEQMHGEVDAVVIGAGTGGTFSGVARYVHERNPNVLKVVVEPQGSILGGGKPGPHKVEGIGNSFFPEALDRALIDRVITVRDPEAFDTVRAMARREGLLVGGSSGAAVCAALQVARELGKGKRVVTVLPDGAERYLSKDIFNS